MLQAAIGACHATARTAEETDWIRIAVLVEQQHRLAGRADAGAQPDAWISMSAT
jgi:predicted RNA polymerase sigma factor